MRTGYRGAIAIQHEMKKREGKAHLRGRDAGTMVRIGRWRQCGAAGFDDGGNVDVLVERENSGKR